MKLATQSLTIILATLLVLLITSTPLDDYKPEILGFLIIISVIWIIIKQRSISAKIKAGHPGGQELFSGSPVEVFTVQVALLLAIFMTGGLSSNLFFLLYFLLFGIVFLFEPVMVIVLLIGLIVVFYTSIFDGDMGGNLIKLGSLVFLSPISYFFGREFSRREKMQEEINDKTGQILEDVRSLKRDVKEKEAFDEIEDIEDQAKELRKDI